MPRRVYSLGILVLSLSAGVACDAPGGGVATFSETSAVVPDVAEETEAVPVEVAPGTPNILELATNVSRLTEGGSIVVSAVVTDADGIDDLIGGTLRDAAGGTYGSFATAATEGAYSMTVSWNQLNTVAPITFERAGSRTLIAEFFDQAGNRSARELVLSLHCDDRPACAGACDALACAGACLSRGAHHRDTLNCGSCGNACAIDATCDDGACSCDGEECRGYCRDTATDRDNCGGCDVRCADGEPCVDGRCRCTEASCGAGAVCVESGCVEVLGLRIVAADGSETRDLGAVEIEVDHAWRRLCADSDVTSVGRVVCAQLGAPLLIAMTDPVPGAIGASCHGDEAHIGACELVARTCPESLLVWCQAR